MIDVERDVWNQTLRQLRDCGQGRHECVVYWIASTSSQNLVSRVVHPKHTASDRYYRVDDAWLTQFWIELARVSESVVVQVHTHGGKAGHSPTDNEGALVYQAGFLSLVLPGFAMREDCQRAAFLAELSDRGVWLPIPVDGRLQWV